MLGYGIVCLKSCILSDGLDSFSPSCAQAVGAATSSQSQSEELLCGLLAIHSQQQAGHMESRPMSVSRAKQGSFSCVQRR
jgi:hypothetical protein